MLPVRIFKDAPQRKRALLILSATLVFTLVRYRLQDGHFFGDSALYFVAAWMMHLFGFWIIAAIATAFYETYSVALLEREPRKTEEMLKDVLVIQAFLIFAAAFLILSSIYQIFTFEE